MSTDAWNVTFYRDGVLEDCARARGPKIVALASNSSGLGLGLGIDALASSHQSVINVLNL